MTVHIIPLEEEEEHEESSTCECEPKVEIVEGGMLIIHDYFKDSEYFEPDNIFEK